MPSVVALVFMKPLVRNADLFSPVYVKVNACTCPFLFVSLWPFVKTMYLQVLPVTKFFYLAWSVMMRLFFSFKNPPHISYTAISHYDASAVKATFDTVKLDPKEVA